MVLYNMTHLKTFLQYVQNRTPLTGICLGQTIEFDVPPRAQGGGGGQDSVVWEV